VQKDTTSKHSFNKLILAYYKEEDILATKECSPVITRGFGGLTPQKVPSPQK